MLTTDDFQDDMEVETEANVYEPFDEFVKQVEMKPLDDTSAEDENEMKVEVGLFTMVSKPVVCLNDEPAEDDEAGEIEDCGRFQEKYSQS
jgi:hypothetical protein